MVEELFSASIAVVVQVYVDEGVVPNYSVEAPFFMIIGYFPLTSKQKR